MREECLTYFPAVLWDEEAGERREDERAYAGAADGDAVGKRAALVEVEADCYDRRQIQQTHADTCQSRPSITPRILEMCGNSLQHSHSRQFQSVHSQSHYHHVSDLIPIPSHSHPVWLMNDIYHWIMKR